ncbi:hypothetical protein CBR_g45709 [Chara braunii]|uniref:Uncharacterized protein n=1 Tax=Chara braunii TaxID=69332 RepID=A0A388K3L5_CHABU|nr:hypothetical protein CBR_g45709 [Chara braunii]|eukprot:GBG64654.1 hypothetical protein CBR_g45709 [Chara braunii]
MVAIGSSAVDGRSDHDSTMENGRGSALFGLSSNPLLDNDSVDRKFNGYVIHEDSPPADLLKELEQVGQAHLVSYWSKLNPTKRRALLSDIQNVDFRRVNLIFNQSTSHGV